MATEINEYREYVNREQKWRAQKYPKVNSSQGLIRARKEVHWISVYHKAATASSEVTF